MEKRPTFKPTFLKFSSFIYLQLVKLPGSVKKNATHYAKIKADQAKQLFNRKIAVSERLPKSFIKRFSLLN